MENITFKLMNGTTLVATRRGNNVAWMCPCQQIVIGSGLLDYQKDIICPNCNRFYYMPLEKKGAIPTEILECESYHDFCSEDVKEEAVR